MQPVGGQVPPGHVWLQGDNTLNSHDSRDYGPVPYNMLLGRVVFRVRRSHDSHTFFVKAGLHTCTQMMNISETHYTTCIKV